MSSSFGQWDLSGFPKAAASFYRAWWLANISTTDAGRPPLPGPAAATHVHIVESWQPPAPPATTRIVHVYTSAPFAALAVNGVAVGAPVAIRSYGAMATFNVSYAAGTITATARPSESTALAADGVTVLATATKSSWGAPAAIVLSLDAPTPSTGTGRAVYLDGQDVALVRATVVDAQGNVCHDSSAVVTFAVTAGPALVWGASNGDPANQNPPHSPSNPAYHGLVRGIVRVTLKATGSDADRALEALVNTDAGAGPLSSSILLAGGGSAPTSISVAATAPGLAAGSITISLSTDPSDAVLATAAASVGVANLPTV